MVKLFEGAKKNWKFVLKFMAFAITFLLVEFAYQFYVASPGEMELSLVRAFSFAGGTLIAAALLSSVIFKFKPAMAKHVMTRRLFGVTGFIFGAMHSTFVIGFLFNWDLFAPYSFGLNPFVNPIVFGTIAYIIFFLLFITSTDWAMAKLGAKWKLLHRLVYFGFWALVSHFLLVNPPALMNLAGYLLIIISFLALAGELFWFIKMRAQKNFSGIGTLIGILVIFLYLITIYFGFVAPMLLK